MKKVKSAIALIMAVSMLFSMTACTSGVKEYDEDSFKKVLEDDLKIDEDDIIIAKSDSSNGSPDAMIITAVNGCARVIAYFCDDEDDAKDYFENEYEEFENSFKTKSFKGNYSYLKTDSYGYIVLNGHDSGTTIFGDLHRTGPIYAGVYYKGSMLVYIMPEGIQKEGKADDDLSELIDAFGFPNV